MANLLKILVRGYHDEKLIYFLFFYHFPVWVVILQALQNCMYRNLVKSVELKPCYLEVCGVC